MKVKEAFGHFASQSLIKKNMYVQTFMYKDNM